MGIDEKEETTDSSTQNDEQAAPAANATDEDKSARVDAAKAFFRAMYAGEEPPPSTAPAGSGDEPRGSSSSCRNCESLEYSLRDAEQKAAESDALYKRMAADFENFRRRNEREREDSISLGVRKTAEAIMPALDDLDRALSFLTPETPQEKVIESFNLVTNRLLNCFEALGLKKINSVGELFDPRFHEPVQQIETTEYPDGVIMQELRKGYMLNDRVVRPSLVNVASNSSSTFGKSADEQSSDANAEASADAGADASAEAAHKVEKDESGEPIKVFDLEIEDA